jgi:hypothetical protein
MAGDGCSEEVSPDMSHFNENRKPAFERAVVVISLDAEKIWGYSDLLNERSFGRRYPNVTDAYDGLLARLCAAEISATWALVGGLSLPGMQGPRDVRLQGLPREWIAGIPAGTEACAPLWYSRSFALRLKAARPAQEIALHGGLTHLIWNHPGATREAIEREIAGGINALGEISLRPRSFIFPRQCITHLELLPAHGISCYRGCAPVLSSRLRRKVPRAVIRFLEERRRWDPPVVWPVESLPGLWNVPASLALYPIARSRTPLVPIRTRIERVERGLEAAVRARGIFHYWLHPETLVEAPEGFPLLDAILEKLVRVRDAGDVEVLTMAQVADRMESMRIEPLECAELQASVQPVATSVVTSEF